MEPAEDSLRLLNMDDSGDMDLDRLKMEIFTDRFMQGEENAFCRKGDMHERSIEASTSTGRP